MDIKLSEQALEGAVRAFVKALDDAGQWIEHGSDYVDDGTYAVVQALLTAGWTPPDMPFDKILRATEDVADELEKYGYLYSHDEVAEKLRDALGRARIYSD